MSSKEDNPADKKVNNSASAEADELEELRRQNSELKNLLKEALWKDVKLEDFPDELRNDREFIIAAVRNRKFDWYSLPQKWKDDAEVACVAFDRHQTSPHFIHDMSERILPWSDLPHHLKMNEEVISVALRSYYGPSWKEIPIWFQANVDMLSTAVLHAKIPFHEVSPDLQRNHREIAFYGLQYGYISADECPCLDAEFFKQALEDGKLEWTKLPETLLDDVNFALSISRFPNELPRQILTHFVQIRSEASFWRSLLYLPDVGSIISRSWFMRLMEEFLSAELRSNHDFMLEMSGGFTGAFSLVGSNLARDRNFLELALDGNPAVMMFLSHETQQLHRDLILRALPQLRRTTSLKEGMRVTLDVARAIRPSFWEESDFAITWVTAGLGFPNGTIDHDLLTDWMRNPELCLASAIHGGDMNYMHLFSGDAAFMLAVVKHHPALYSEATGAAQTDPWVMTTAFAALPELAESVMMKLHFQGKDDEIAEYLLFLRRNLIPFETFSACILGNMLSTQSVEATGTNMTLLNQGLETSSKYKKLLAEYVGIPTGEWLCRLQQAERNVQKVTPLLGPKRGAAFL